MKWNGLGRGVQALGVSLAVGLGMTACSRDYTVAYVYATAAGKGAAAAMGGSVNAYSVDYQSGALQQLADSPIPSGGVNPVGLVPAPNGESLYVLNQNSSNVVLFSIGTDGKIYGGQTTPVVQNAAKSVIGSFPTAAAIDPTGNFLYVTFTYQNGFTPAQPGPGGVAVYPIMHSNDPAVEGTLGAPLLNTAGGSSLPYTPVGNHPVGLVVSPKGGFVYVIDQENNGSGTPVGVILTFTAGSTGALTPVAGPTLGGFAVGTAPSAIAEDPTGRYLYITDQTTNQLYAFAVTNGGAPTAILGSPYVTGQYPLSVKIEPRGKFVYVANFTSSTVSVYAIDQHTGALSGAGGGVTVAAQPTCVTIEPALGVYLYTSNNTDNSISASQLNSNTGGLIQVQGTAFSAQALPTCVVSVANGAHATSIVQ